MKLMQKLFWSIYSANRIALLCYFIIAIIAFLPILASDKHIGHAIDWNVPDDPLLLERQFYVNNYVWWDNFGGVDRGFYLRGFFYNFVALLPAVLLGISGSIMVKAYIIIASVAGAYFFFLFSQNLQNRLFGSNNTLVSFLAGLFYSMSAFKINFLISGEFYGFQFAFALIPLLLIAFLNYAQIPSLRNIIKVSILFIAVFIGWQQFIFLIIPFLVILLVFFGKVSNTIAYLKTTAVFFVLAVSLSAWFTLPSLVFRTFEDQITEASIPIGYRQAATTFSLQNSLLDIDWNFHFLITEMPSLYLYSVFLIIVLLPFILFRNNRKVFGISAALLSISLFYIMLAGGINGALGNFIIGMSDNNLLSIFLQLFRSPVDFLIGYHIFFSILLVLGLYGIWTVLNNQKIPSYILSGFLIALILMPHAAWHNYLLRDLTEGQVFPNLYIENQEVVSFYHSIDSNEDFRILTLPPTQFVQYLPNEFQNQREWSYDPLILWSPKQTIDESGSNRYIKPHVRDLINKGLIDLNFGSLAQNLKTFNIKYIIIRNDVKAPEWFVSSSINFEKVIENMDKSDLFHKVFEGETMSAYEFTMHNPNKIQLNTDPVLQGKSVSFKDITLYNVNDGNIPIAKDLRIEPISCSGTTFVNNSASKTTIDFQPCSNTKWIDVVKPFLVDANSIYRFEISEFESTMPFHIKVFFQAEEVENGNDRLVKTLPVHGKDAYYFYDSPAQGLTLGELKGNFDTFFLNLQQGEHAYAYIALIINNDDITDSQADTARIQYTKIDPTRWKVELRNLSEQSLLSFAESYSPNWEARLYKNEKLIAIQESIPIDKSFNGFQIDETGDIDIIIVYKPQELFEAGIIVSSLVLSGCLIFLYYDRPKSPFRWLIKLNVYFASYVALLRSRINLSKDQRIGDVHE